MYAAIGPRPLLDLPDSINLKLSPVKIEESRSILVRNLGNVSAVFSILANPPFKVSPTEGVLGSHESMKLTVMFKSLRIGTYRDFLTICYETGEKLSVHLQASASNEDIVLECNSVEFEDTFMQLKRYKQFRLFNHSNHIINFRWKQNKSIEDDNNESDKLKKGFEEIKNQESLKYAKLQLNEIIDGTGHGNVYNRIYQDELDEYEKNVDNFFYASRFFEILPNVNVLLFSFWFAFFEGFFFTVGGNLAEKQHGVHGDFRAETHETVRERRLS